MRESGFDVAQVIEELAGKGIKLFPASNYLEFDGKPTPEEIELLRRHKHKIFSLLEWPELYRDLDFSAWKIWTESSIGMNC